MLPSGAQGAIGIECLESETEWLELLKPLNHEKTEICVNAEREFLLKLGASCQTPVAVLAEFVSDDEIRIRAFLAKTSLETKI